MRVRPLFMGLILGCWSSSPKVASGPNGEGGAAGAANPDSRRNFFQECVGFNGCAASQFCKTPMQCHARRAAERNRWPPSRASLTKDAPACNALVSPQRIAARPAAASRSHQSGGRTCRAARGKWNQPPMAASWFESKNHLGLSATTKRATQFDSRRLSGNVPVALANNFEGVVRRNVGAKLHGET